MAVLTWAYPTEEDPCSSAHRSPGSSRPTARCPVAPSVPSPSARPTPCSGRRCSAPWPDGYRGRLLRAGLLLGRRAEVLAGPRRLLDVRRLPGWLHPQRDVRRGLQRPYGAHRGRPGRLRPREGAASRTCSRSSGRSTTRPRATARPTTSARSTARPSTGPPTHSGRPTRRRRPPTSGALDQAGFDPITTDDARWPEFYYAEDYHQQYLYKNPHGYDCHSSTGRAVPDA